MTSPGECIDAESRTCMSIDPDENGNVLYCTFHIWFESTLKISAHVVIFVVASLVTGCVGCDVKEQRSVAILIRFALSVHS